MAGYESGSQWRRWNPHIHAPGTLMNDQFNGDWEGYLAAIETATPTVEVLGITDYCTIEGYKEVVRQKAAGRLPGVHLIFPNVEFRLTLETAKQKGINAHLLFCPDDADHVEQIERALNSLVFEYQHEQFHCTVADLERLGKRFDASATTPARAREVGGNQFKISLAELQKMIRNSRWAQENCLIGVAAGSNDGTAGLQQDASFAAMRQEVERAAHVIFTSNGKSREFWLGRADKPKKKIIEIYGGLKPCIHGCDAHSVDKVCLPDGKKHCWIKGDPTFETLRQVLLEPDERVFIGEISPGDHSPSACITTVATTGTPWLTSGAVPLNPSLVAIIGSRGSGKTALADIIATGAGVTSPLTLHSSFLYRATHPEDRLGNARVRLTWGDGQADEKSLKDGVTDDFGESVRYLSQQFVEQLCSAEGLAVELKKEIERVIFEATDSTQRFDAESFDELADIHLNPIRTARAEIRQSIENTSEKVNAEAAVHAKLSIMKKEREDRQKKIEKLKADMKELMPKGQEERTKRLADLEAAVTAASAAVEKLNRALVRIENLRQDADRFRKFGAPSRLEKLKTDYQETGLSSDEWDAFSLIFKGDINAVLDSRKAAINEQIATLRDIIPGAINHATEPFAKWPLKMLLAERDKVKGEVGIDQQRQSKYGMLQRQLETEQRQFERSAGEIEHAEGAAERRRAHIRDRKASYEQVFQTFLDEQKELQKLYAPLETDLQKATGSLSRLRFTVSREIDLDAWADKGEQLLDLRKESALRGHGALKKVAAEKLLPAWRTGTAAEVSSAMSTFGSEMFPELRKLRPATETNEAEWAQRLGTWVYSTDHIEMRYSVTYDGVAIEQLSPGTRGIVLLLLYLVIDKQDRRPLIIDQPEENLDPKSVFQELVPHFREARKRRQVIIVTHNANLVVNTDADQVIVASSEPNPAGGLPTVTYSGGSLENPVTRTSVCEILEGGEQAFKDRERRYRLQRGDQAY